MGQIISVSSAEELSAAISIARAGDQIELQAGNYGELNLSNVRIDGSGIEITSADPNNKAIFDKVTLYRCENLHFDQIEINFEPTGNTGYKVGFRAAEGSDISITNSVLHGGFNEDHPDPEYAAAPVGLGVQIQRVDNVTITGNEIFDFHGGMSIAYTDGLTVNDNYVHDLRTSFLTGGGLGNVEVIGNHFSSTFPIDLGGTGDHADMIHFYPLTNQVGPMKNIVIRDNFMEQGAGPDAILGIYIDDAGSGGSGLGYTNVVIDNNVIHNGDAQGIRVENVDGLQITNNSLLQSSGTGLGQAPGVVLTSGTQNVLIDNNIIAGLISGSSVGASSVSIGDNVFVQDRDPSGQNYVGDLFVNGLTPDGDSWDFTPIAGSAVDGYGANLFDLPQGVFQGLISSTPEKGLDMQTVHFDATTLYDNGGAIDFTGATLLWDFGDGYSATGNSVTHTFGAAGSYDVTASFAFANGQTIQIDKTVDVFTPTAVEMDFEGGIADTSDIRNKIEVVGDVALEADRFGDALRLTESGSRVEVIRSEEILDNPEFSISFAFKKDGGTATNSDDGMIVYYSGTSYISTKNGSIAFTGSTSTGRIIQLEASASKIEDGAWHQVTYTFSANERAAVLYLDGQEVDRMDKVSGIQKTTNGHDLHLGGRTGGAFGGLIDEFHFDRAALSAQEVQARYDALFNGAPEPAPTPEPEPEPTPTPEPEPVPHPEQDNIVMIGGAGADTLIGQDGNDILIGDANGLYHIDDSAKIFRLYESVFGREPDLNGHQAWVLKLITGEMTLQKITSAFIGSPEFQATYGAADHAEFITLLYNNVLGRIPSGDDHDYWVQRLETNMTREQAVLLFSESTEHASKTAAALDSFHVTHDVTTWADDVFRLYQAILDRDPDANGYMNWTDILASGSKSMQQLVSDFMDSAEFQNTYGSTSNAEFVHLLYQNVLDRTPSHSEITYWSGRIDSDMPRSSVVLFFVDSNEFTSNSETSLQAFIQAHGPDDVINSGAGDDVVAGGLWSDTFIFTNDGLASTVTVTDLEPWDRLDFSDFSLSPQEVLNMMDQSGDNVVFNSGSETIIFANTQLSEMTQDMILV